MVVHLAGVVDPIADVALMARVNVEGTRRVLDAAASVGARRIVRISSATVYGAWPNNPLPLTEDAALRPNPDFSPGGAGRRGGAAAGRVAGRATPSVTVTTLRSAPVVGPGRRTPPRPHPPRAPAAAGAGRGDAGAGGARRRPRVGARARRHPRPAGVVQRRGRRVARRRRGPRAASRGPTAPAVPAEVLERWLRRTWGPGMGDIPAGVVPYLVHPWVIANDRLKGRGLGAEPHQRRGDPRGALRAAATPAPSPARSPPRSSSPRASPRSGSAAPSSPQASIRLTPRFIAPLVRR